MSGIFCVDSINKQIDNIEILQNISFCANSGEILGIIGPNGAGKTTLMECVCGLLSADSGSVSLNGQTLDMKQRSRTLFYLPDRIVPYQNHRVDYLLCFFADAYGVGMDKKQEIIELLSLQDSLEKEMRELSKGWVKRVMLALGMLVPQSVVMMDEPFDGFDFRQIQEVMHLLKLYVKSAKTLILSIHQLGDAQKICDKYLLINAGQTCAFGSIEELRAIVGVADATLEEVFLALL